MVTLLSTNYENPQYRHRNKKDRLNGGLFVGTVKGRNR